MNYTLEKANEYIKANKSKVNPIYRLKYHMSAPIGWMNDPNGLVKFNDEYHLFYQFYPYDSKWGPMHWGHFVTKDLINYKDLDVALAPDEKEETGCFSGGALIDDNKINLVYTRHFEKEDFKSEKDVLANSDDAIHFEKRNVLFDNDLLPKDYSRKDFRDPAPYKIGDKYYIFMGARNEKTNEGIIVVLESEELANFKYSFTIGPIYEFGDMAECPSYHRVDGYDVLIASGCHVKEKGNSYKNDNSSVFILGKIDFENKKMDILNVTECDKGDSFYAPQFIQNEKEPIIIGWLEMWGKDIPTNTLGHGWAGAYTIPRKLRVENNRIYQKPICLKDYYSPVNGNRISRVSHIDLYAKGNFNVTFKAHNGFFSISGNKDSILLDTTCTNNLYNKIRRTDYGYDEVKLEVLLDNSSVELFVNDGEFTISSRIYLDTDYDIIVDGDVTLVKNNINR